MSFEAMVYCENCGKEADRALCEGHLDGLIADAFNDGKKEGYDQGYDKGLEDAESNKEV